MQRCASKPVNLADVDPRIAPTGGYRYWTLAHNESELSMTVGRRGISIVRWEDGFSNPHGTARQLEYHPLHEEIFVLEGAIRFGDAYSVTAPGYKNHPPFWLHPTVQTAVGQLTLLVRTSIDPAVMFAELPDAWDAIEGFAPGTPTRCEGVTRLQLDALAWRPVERVDGEPAGFEAKRIYDDADDGWVTWLMRVPAGWRGTGPRREFRGGDELYVLEGDLTLDAGRLDAETYFCDPDRWVDGGEAESSDAGCLAIRWSRGHDLRLPALRARSGQ